MPPWLGPQNPEFTVFTLQTPLAPGIFQGSFGSFMRTTAELTQLVNSVKNPSLRNVLDLLWLDYRGTAAVQRGRVLSLLDGPERKHRVALLDLTLLIAAAIPEADRRAFDPATIDWAEYDDEVLSGAVFFDRFAELCYEAITRFAKFPPHRLLNDINLHEDDTESNPAFKIPNGYSWPSLGSLSAFAVPPGSDADSGAGGEPAAEQIAELASRLAAAEKTLASVPDAVQAQLRSDIAENRFGVGGNASMATLRKTLAFNLNPKEFFLYGSDVETDGSRRVLCDASNPLSRSKLDRFFFENQLTEQDAARINRRSLVPDSVMVSARVLENEHKAAIGGEGSSRCQAHEQLRIRQQTHIKQSQPLLKVVAFASSAHADINRLKDQHEDPDDPFTLDDSLLDILSDVGRNVEGILYGASDSLHLIAMECTDLERKRDDIFVQDSSGNPALKVNRPTSDPLRNVKDVSHLVALAAAERSRLNGLASTRRSSTSSSTRSPGGSRPRSPRPTTPPAGGGRRRPNTAERAAQSKRDKAAHAAKKAGSPAPASTPSKNAAAAKKKK